ncbi:MAG: Pr6Pr family membrane protein [Nocardioidaceae bacterium]|nr:Pr6Pr family membrane protein [Nocardioidaceae bacterium]
MRPVDVALRVARLAFAALAVAALVTCYLDSRDAPGFTVGNFWGYFTNLSNLLTVVVLAAGALVAPRSARMDAVRGAVAFCMAVTGLVFAVLLRDVGVGVLAPWVNTVVHQVMPVVMVADFLVSRRARPIEVRAALTWLALPLVYLVYTLVRGPLADDFYPYPFVDVATRGYGPVLATSLVLLLGGALLAVGLAALGNRLDAARSPVGVS